MSRLVASLALAGAAAAAPRMLAPANDINHMESQTASDPLNWLGANGPYIAGENLFGISSEVPDGCVVDMAAYNVRHGSRYPDPGAYSGWVDMYERFQNASFTAKGSLSFLKSWSPVLTNPSIQMSQESPTGYKEAFDLGYTLRTRYAGFYEEGTPFYAWANNYTRVLQTAQMFVHGYMGPSASTLGKVVSVSSQSPFSDSIGNSLSPSDQCPLFNDDGGQAYLDQWGSVFITPIKRRLTALFSEGTFNFTDNDITQIPYLCGFESQILGRMSPWCDIFTNDELKSYEYWNDLRYYYGIGPGTNLNKKMMTPYLGALINILATGPGQTGTAKDGKTFDVPSLLMAFMNDGQLTELATSSGVYDEQRTLNASVRDDSRIFMARRYVTMRGTVAFERLVCSGKSDYGHRTRDSTSHGANATSPTPASTYIRIRLNDAVYPVPSCRSGPGSSCPIDEYVAYVKRKQEAEGNWMKNCNVTNSAAPATAEGARFFTDLEGDYLQLLSP